MITREATAAVAEAVSALERFRESLSPAAAAEHEEDLNALLGVLAADPVLGRVLALQDSLAQLRRHLQRHPSVLPNDFDFCPQTGALTLGAGAVQLGEDEVDREVRDEEEEEEEDDNNNNNNNSDSCEPSSEADRSLSHAAAAGAIHYSPELSGSSVVHFGRAVTTPGYLAEFERAVARGAAGRQVLRVELARPPGASLGFSVVGLRSPSRGELGIFVQELQPNGIAQRDGRLEEGDQILAIDGQPLDSNISHQQAIGILQQARGTVQLVLARGTPVSSTPPAPQGTPPPPPLPSGGSLSGSLTSVAKPAAADREEAMVLGTEWAEVEAVELLNDGSGLGFGIIGGRSTGVVVKTVLPGGVADRDGRLQSGDHILQIGEVNLRGLGSEQVASVLRQAGSRVRLVVARPSEAGELPAPRPPSLPPPLVLPTRLLADAEELERRLQMHGATVALAAASGSSPTLLSEMVLDDLPETETFEVELVKDQQGLGITIAGYVCEKGTQDEISGIFVKSVAKGSAADASGCIRVNDQIIEVDGRPLQGYTNHQAVEVLRSTGKAVKLRLARHLRGLRYHQLQQAIALSDATGGGTLPPLPVTPTTPTMPVGGLPSPLLAEQAPPLPRSLVMEDGILAGMNLDATGLSALGLTEEDDGMFAGELDYSTEATIIAHWSKVVGPEFEIVVAQLSKFEPSGGLGISLEGTVDVEDGREVRPHHYIRSVLPDGPVGLNGRLRPGDELLQVNGRQLLGLHHRDVVGALKQLPLHVRLVCARPLPPPLPLHGPPLSARSPITAADDEQGDFLDDHYPGPAQSPTGLLGRPSSSSSASPPPPLLSPSSLSAGGGGAGGVGGSVLGGSLPALVKAKSDGSLAQPDWDEGGLPGGGPLVKLRSRSLEPLTGLAMWSSEPHVVELLKGDRGLGFSILDYQDPMNPSETVIVIRSLVPGGVAQQDGRLIPGDRLLFVNEVPLQHAGLDAAVQALKGAPRGIVRIGVAKPLPLPPPAPDSATSMTSASSTQVGGHGGLRRPPLLKAESF